MQKRRMGGRRERGEGGGRERKRKREMEEERARWRNGGGGEEEKSDGHSERREKRERARRAVGTQQQQQQHGPRPSPQRARRWTRRRVLTGSGPVIGSEAAVANGGHAKSRRYWPAPKATAAAPQPPSNPPSKYTCPAIHHCPLPTAHSPLDLARVQRMRLPSSTRLSSTRRPRAMHRQRRCAHPPAAACACAWLAFSSLLLVRGQQTLASSHWRSFSRAAWCSSGPETVAPSQLARPVHRSLISAPPALPCRLQTADCRRTCQAPSHQNMLVLLCRRSILTLSSWLRRGWRPAGACAAFTRDNTCPTALVTRPSPVSPAGHRASSVR
ncbi:hypothetical protein J3E74DRAFT_437121 [Bipolaris maydis]|nr:hypothetical protein J3E74DRAFT_437121 [Bipolaris maydis]